MRIALALLVALAGCSGREDVVITGTDVYSTPTGIVKFHADMSNLRVQIFAGDERLPAVPVQGDASGQIVVKGVPDGPFVIAVQSDAGRWWWASESHDVEWSWEYAGRVDARRAEVQQPITLAVDGLAAWREGDSVAAYSLETSTEMEPEFEPALIAGSTEIQATFDWNSSQGWSSNKSYRPYLIDAGDHFTLARTTGTFDAIGVVRRMTELLDLEALRQDAGAALTIAGTMTKLELNVTSRFTVDHPAFASALPTPPTYPKWGIAVYQTPPWAGGWGLGTSVISLSGGASNEDEVATTVEDYALPFDPAWETWISTTYDVGALGQTYASSMTRLDDANFVLRPREPFAAEVLLDGQSSATGTVIWDGTSPIELEVPGAGRGFSATLWLVRPSNMDTSWEYIGWLRSGSDSITMPRGVFASGERYMLEITIGAEDATGYAYSFSTLGPFAFSSP